MLQSSPLASSSFQSTGERGAVVTANKLCGGQNFSVTQCLSSPHVKKLLNYWWVYCWNVCVCRGTIHQKRTSWMMFFSLGLGSQAFPQLDALFCRWPGCGGSRRTVQPWTTTSWADPFATTTRKASCRRSVCKAGENFVLWVMLLLFETGGPTDRMSLS